MNNINLKKLIKSKMEPTEPANSLHAFLSDNISKPLTKRTIDKLNKLFPGHNFRLRLQYGMANIEWGGYGREWDKTPGGSLLMAHEIKNVRIEQRYLDSFLESCKARDERNARRQEILSDSDCLIVLEEAVSRYLSAEGDLVGLLEEYPDRYAIEKAYEIDL